MLRSSLQFPNQRRRNSLWNMLQHHVMIVQYRLAFLFTTLDDLFQCKPSRHKTIKYEVTKEDEQNICCHHLKEKDVSIIRPEGTFSPFHLNPLTVLFGYHLQCTTTEFQGCYLCTVFEAFIRIWILSTE